jgi:hypothetical protein
MKGISRDSGRSLQENKRTMRLAQVHALPRPGEHYRTIRAIPCGFCARGGYARTDGPSAADTRPSAMAHARNPCFEPVRSNLTEREKAAKGSAAAAVVAEPKLREPLHNAGDSGCSRYNLPRTRQKPGMHPAATLLLTMPDGAPILQRSSRALSSVG